MMTIAKNRICTLGLGMRTNISADPNANNQTYAARVTERRVLASLVINAALVAGFHRSVLQHKPDS